MTTMLDVLDKSVTQGNAAEGPYSSAPRYQLQALFVPSFAMQGILPELPWAWSRDRDYILRQTPRFEGNWASAVNRAITMIASKDYDVTSSFAERAKQLQEMMLDVDFENGWVQFISKVLHDFLCTDNGAFIEIIRPTNSPGARILGLAHLDSLRCRRTGDPEYPVVYRDLKGYEHALKWYQVIMLSDMPSPDAALYNMGECAASRAYNAIRLQMVIDRFVIERAGGFHPTQMHFVNGVTDTQIKNAAKAQEVEATQRGAVVYRGAIIVPMIEKERVSRETIDLAALPADFNYDKYFSAIRTQFALALGLAIQDLVPLTGQALGTGAQSEVLDNKAKGQGLAAFVKALLHALNTKVFPKKAMFTFVENDLRDQKEKADIDATLVGAFGASVTNGILTPPEARQELVDKKVFSKNLAVASVPDDSLSDTEKADVNTLTAVELSSRPQILQQQPPQPGDLIEVPDNPTGASAGAV